MVPAPPAAAAAALRVLSPSSLEYILVGSASCCCATRAWPEAAGAGGANAVAVAGRADAGSPGTAGTCPLPKLLGACAGAGAGADEAGANGAFCPLPKLFGACGARIDSHVTYTGRKRGARQRARHHSHATPRTNHTCARPPVRALAREPATREPALRHRHPSARCRQRSGDRKRSRHGWSEKRVLLHDTVQIGADNAQSSNMRTMGAFKRSGSGGEEVATSCG